MTSPPYVGFCPKVQFVQSCNIDKNNTQSDKSPRVCPMLYAIQYIHLSLDHNNRTNTVYWNEINTCLRCKCLNSISTSNLLFLLIIVAVYRQSKQKTSSRI